MRISFVCVRADQSDVFYSKFGWLCAFSVSHSLGETSVQWIHSEGILYLTIAEPYKKQPAESTRSTNKKKYRERARAGARETITTTTMPLSECTYTKYSTLIKFPAVQWHIAFCFASQPSLFKVFVLFGNKNNCNEEKTDANTHSHTQKHALKHTFHAV